MNERWEEQKEKFVSLRAEYAALFTHFHFFQGLRFAVLAAALSILGALFSSYRTALPFKEIVRLWHYGVALNIDPYTATIVSVFAVGVLIGLRSIERGIMLQTSAIIIRGSIIEVRLDIQEGIFESLKTRLGSIKIFHRISGIMRIGIFVLGSMCVGFVVLGLWATIRSH